ncbi:DUF3616 domain-containing protein [Rhizobacter sp. OV335]|uniref:DUF3616 domain-containing protein n=1 Tax=Rhizobacter sp. OV335 TaxID=1500264 RepID=UPI00091D34DC|nr:DUF3616 domain-containing protein [Rhizobacter sp. OV335]SHM56688.1 Protein of unknown function [Rhizobacter sp. OV335]
MKTLPCRRIAGLLFTLLAAADAMAQAPERYRGLCDASAAVALDARHFVVADDEHNTLQVFRRDAPDAVGRVDLDRFLGTEAGRESDIEGAAESGGVIYWIASHGRNSAGKKRDERHRLFATERVPGAAPPSLRPVGTPYTRLLDDLLDAPQLKGYHLKDASKLPPEAPGGLNIEGLAATPAGALLVGLRNPLPRGRALVVAIDNPAQVVRGQRAKIGSVFELPLGGRGIRSLERVGNGYLVVAGPPADDGSFALYRWSGTAGAAPVPVPSVAFGSLRPEALFAWPESGEVQLLSDDGGVRIGGEECKALPASQRVFRSLVVRP